MKDISLVIMAAGLGSRFKGGIKQLAKVGDNGEILLSYAIHDAKCAGFNKVIFIIRKELESDLKELIKDVTRDIKVEYIYQETTDLPLGYSNLNRTKPWGTGHAIWCLKDIKEPFVVINSDDYYGREIFTKMYEYMISNYNSLTNYCMGAYSLSNTLSKTGSVNRGLCTIKDGNLINVVETYNIKSNNGVIESDTGVLNKADIVSMNMWGLSSNFIELLDNKFKTFLDNNINDLKAEFLLPDIIDELIKASIIKVNAINTSDSWFGMTYTEDIEETKKELHKLTELKKYPNKL